MGLTGKLTSQISIKCDRDKFFDVLKEPCKSSEMCPEIIHSVELHSGQWGTPGAVTFWNFVLDGKLFVSKEIIEAVDEEKRSITYNAVEGNLMQLYKSLRYYIDVNEDNVVTCTLDYEKLNENVPEPKALMDVCINITKRIENHHLLVPN